VLDNVRFPCPIKTTLRKAGIWRGCNMFGDELKAELLSAYEA